MCVNTCCSCASLKKGTIIIGFVFTGLHALALLLKIVHDFSNKNRLTERLGIQDDVFFNLHNELMILCLIFGVLGLLSSIFLIVGSSKGVKWLLVPWLLVSFVENLVVLFFIVPMITPMTLMLFGSIGVPVIIIILVGVFVALHVYCMIVVASHFKELVTGRSQGGSYRADGKIFSAPPAQHQNILPN